MRNSWFRFYNEALDDLKLARAASASGQERVVVLGIWVGLLALANSEERGRVLLCVGLPLSVEEMALKIGVSPDVLGLVLAEFEGLRMVHWEEGVLVITNMQRRQFDSDNSTERVRRYRERQREQEGQEHGNGDETLHETLPATPPDQKQRQKQNKDRTEQKPAPPGAGPPSLFTVLAALCQVDLDTMTEEQRGALNQTCGYLRRGKAQPDMLGVAKSDRGTFAHWWYTKDWRGKKPGADPPHPHQVRECWGKFLAWQGRGCDERRRDYLSGEYGEFIEH